MTKIETFDLILNVFANTFSLIALSISSVLFILHRLKHIVYKNMKIHIANGLIEIFCVEIKNKEITKKQIYQCVNKWQELFLCGEEVTPAKIISDISLLYNKDVIQYLSSEDCLMLSKRFQKCSAELVKKSFLISGITFANKISVLCNETARLLFDYSLTTKLDTHIETIDLSEDAKLFVPNLPQGIGLYRVQTTYMDKLHMINCSESNEMQQKYKFSAKQLKLYDINNELEEQESCTRPFLYDGILPALKGKYSFQFLKDQRDGTLLIRISIEATSYSTLVRLRSADKSILFPRVLTLSMIVLTNDNKIIIIKRSGATDSYQNQYISSVNGNMDLPHLSKHSKDVDKYGIPSFIRAISREAKEELNQDLIETNIVTTGIGQIFTSKDNGTYVLTFLYKINKSFSEIKKESAFADPIDGGIEVEDIESIDFPQNDFIGFLDEIKKMRTSLRIYEYV